MGVVDEALVSIGRAFVFTITYLMAALGLFLGWLAVFVFIQQYVQLPTLVLFGQIGLARELMNVPLGYPVVLTGVSVGVLMRALFPSILP